MSLRSNLDVVVGPGDAVSLRIPDPWMSRIEPKVFSTPRFTQIPTALQQAKTEVNEDYRFTHHHFLVDSATESFPSTPLDQTGLIAELGGDWSEFQGRIAQCSTAVFPFKKYRLERSSVIYTPEPFKAFSEILVSAVAAHSKRFLFTTDLPKLVPVPLQVYVSKQKEHIKPTEEFVRVEWLDFVVTTIKNHLKNEPQLRYDTDEKDWNVFEVSKISKYLTLMRFVMEDTLRTMVLESLDSFLNKIKALTEPFENVDQTYEWGNDLVHTEFPPPQGHHPLWALELTLSSDGPTYDHFLSDFSKELTGLMTICVDATAGIPDILPLIMKNLLFGEKKTLHSIPNDDPAVVARISELQGRLAQALGPVEAYAKKFTAYLPIWDLDLEQFMNEWNSADHTAEEVRAAADFHLHEHNQMETEIPNSIDLGPFRIQIEPLRTELLRRKKLVHTSILESFANKLRSTISEILEGYEEIKTKLSTRSEDIEEVMELKLFLAEVPALLTKNQDTIQNIMRDYEVFEVFKFPISREDFEARWTALMGLRKMYKFADEAVHWLGGDYRKLLRVQKSDMSDLNVAVEVATSSVATLSTFVDISNISEARTQVDVAAKVVQELQHKSDIFNRRQLVFGLPAVQKETVAALVQTTHKYESLWATIGDWLKIEEDAFNLPMDQLDMTGVNQIITDGLKVVRRSKKYFGQLGELGVKELARKVKRQIKAFRKLVPLILVFTHAGFRARHLEATSQVCGFEVVATSSSTLKALVDQGLSPYVPEIEKIGQDCEHELEIELELTKMETDATEIKASLQKDPKTGIETVTVPEGTDEFLESCAKKTGEFQESPYKGPFAEYLRTWENKLRMATSTLNRIRTIGPDWIQFQEESEAGGDGKTREETFEKMGRIWRRITRIIRGTPQVVEFGSNKTLGASISQFEELRAYIRPVPEGNRKSEDTN